MMIEDLSKLSDRVLKDLTAALRSGRLQPPYSSLSLERLIHAHERSSTASLLAHFANINLSPDQIAVFLELLVSDRERTSVAMELVATGPESPGVSPRDTGVVVRDLFANAERSVLVAGYAVYQGKQVFAALAERMNQIPSLAVRFFLDIGRRAGDTTMPAEVVQRFTTQFCDRHWPTGCRLPELFYDPRSCSIDPRPTSALHAKSIVVDDERVFISSANFTEAAQERNIEIGLKVASSALGRQITEFFDGMVVSKRLEKVAWPKPIV